MIVTKRNVITQNVVAPKNNFELHFLHRWDKICQIEKRCLVSPFLFKFKSPLKNKKFPFFLLVLAFEKCLTINLQALKRREYIIVSLVIDLCRFNRHLRLRFSFTRWIKRGCDKGATTFSLMTLSIMTFSLRDWDRENGRKRCCYAESDLF
jgi:hypothetical protein